MPAMKRPAPKSPPAEKKAKTSAAAKKTSESSNAAKQTDSIAPTLYDVLEVSCTATAAEITKAYRKLALKHHPDKQAQSGADSTARFQVIQEAYEVLKDTDKRSKYDRYGTLDPEDIDVELFAKCFGSKAELFEEKELDSFFVKYYGSKEEEKDIREFLEVSTSSNSRSFNKSKLKSFFSDVIGAEPVHCERYLKIMKDNFQLQLEEGEVKMFRNRAEQWRKKASREKREFEKDKSEDFDLMAAIMQNRQSQINPGGALAQALREAEFSSGPKKKK